MQEEASKNSFDCSARYDLFADADDCSQSENCIGDGNQKQLDQLCEKYKVSLDELGESVAQVELLTPLIDDLTHSQNQRFEIYLENLLEIRATIVQMIRIHVEEEQLSENLLSLLDIIDRAIPPESNQNDATNNPQENKNEKSEESHELAEYLNAIAINQLIDNLDEEDVSLYQKLEEEKNNKRIQKIPTEIKEKAKFYHHTENFGNLIQELYEKKMNQKALEQAELEKLQKIKNFVENSFVLNPLESESEVCEKETLTLKGIFNPTNTQLQTWQCEAKSVIEYVEVKITKRHRSFKPPLVLTLWEEKGDLQFELAPKFLSSLSPFGFAFFQNSENASPQYFTGSEQVSEGDVVGVGMIPLNGNNYLFFGTYNGKWIGHFTQFTCVVPYSEITQKIRLVLLTGSTFQANQLDVEVNRNKENFVFDLSLSLEECSICYCDVINYCMETISGCGHQFCGLCMTNYLENCLNEGIVVDTQCPDSNCTQLLCDTDIQKSLSTLNYGKFQQFRILAHMRLNPNIRWCPTDNCPGGIVGNPNDSSFPKLICEVCRISFCYECSQVWHEGFTCKSFMRHLKSKEKGETKKKRKKDTKDMVEWLRDNKSIKCAKCGALVQRESGCNHITCRCGYEFCWLCGESIYVSIEDTPLHYLSGACAGLQMSSKNELTKKRKVIRTAIAPVRFGITLPAVAVGSVARSIRERRRQQNHSEPIEYVLSPHFMDVNGEGRYINQ